MTFMGGVLLLGYSLCGALLDGLDAVYRLSRQPILAYVACCDGTACFPARQYVRCVFSMV